MSAYYPPAENVPIFDASLFRTTNSQLLTRAVASSSFLTFPIAQGTETLKDIIVEGTASFTNTALPTSTATPLPASNDSSTKIPTTAWVQSAITANLGSVGTTISVNYASTPIPSGSTTILPETLALPSAGTYLIVADYELSAPAILGSTISCNGITFLIDNGSFSYDSNVRYEIVFSSSVSQNWIYTISLCNVITIPSPQTMITRVSVGGSNISGSGRASAIRLL
jgi:hypothetical protein